MKSFSCLTIYFFTLLSVYDSFRGQVEPDGENPKKYWRTLAYKLIFIILFEVLYSRSFHIYK